MKDTFTIYFAATGIETCKAWFRPNQMAFEGTNANFVNFLQGVCRSAQCEGDEIKLVFTEGERA